MGQKVLINVEPEDIRVAVIEEGVLTDLFIENRHIGDFRAWKDHDSYQRAFERLLRDLKATP